ncbi:MAG: cysteine-rich CWC family protein [Acidobacteria bacterium]|jgi:hypothetical protein|nr:cysteine-rich CWC family protein [Acidobacteriota bacterium]MBA4123626.1 cysteine-rich CWC family protein [Acidobacteriota bacterium]
MRKKPLEIKTVETVSEKLCCESCGKEFSCGANVGKCWCFTVELKAEKLAKLGEDFESCLCKNCLGKLATNNAKNTN